MVTKEEAIKAAKTLEKWCKGKNCEDCVFGDVPSGCIFCECHTPLFWKIPKPRSWSDADVAMAKALKMYGYTMVEHCLDGQLLAKKGNDLWFYLPTNFASGVMRPGDSVSLDDIIREADHV